MLSIASEKMWKLVLLVVVVISQVSWSYGEKIYGAGTFAKVNWYTAQQYCRSEGMYLANADTQKDARNIQAFIKANNRIAPGTQFWLSGSNLADSTTWNWFHLGHTLGYRNWRNGVVPTTASSCLMMNYDGVWEARSCGSTLLYFICEYDCYDIIQG